MKKNYRNRWISEYISGIDLSNIEWVKFNGEQLKEFYENNYLDKKVWKYVSDEDDSILFPPIGLTYLSLYSYNDKCNYLLGLVNNNVGKKTIISSMVYMDNYYVFEEQEKPLTYIYSVETNLYFLNKGVYTKLCNEVIKFIDPNQHIIISDESEMGRDYGVINKLRNILVQNGFNGKMFVDDCLMYRDLDFYQTINCKKRKLC